MFLVIPQDWLEMHLTSCHHGDQFFLQQQTGCKIVTGRACRERQRGTPLGLSNVWQVSSTAKKEEEH